MTDSSIRADLETNYETELSRLGSSKALYALTAGEMETAAILEALAARSARAAATFDGWTDTPDYDETFATAAEVARSQAEEIADVGSGIDPGGTSSSAGETLRGLEGADARLGGLLAWTLLTDSVLSQAVGYFVGNADPQTADRFRELRTDVDDLRTAVAEPLDGADQQSARQAASDVIEAAYADYVAALEAQGVKVKPVC